jgi:hypothetical protein
MVAGEFKQPFLNGLHRSVNRKVQGSNPCSGANFEFESSPKRASHVEPVATTSGGYEHGAGTCSSSSQPCLPRRIRRLAFAVFPVTVNDTDFTLSGVPADITAAATGPSGAVVTYTMPIALDEDPNPPKVTCDPASGSIFPVGATTVFCQAPDGDDLGSAIAFFHVTVMPDVQLTISVNPSTVRAHATVTTTASVADLGTVSTRVTATYALTFTDSTGITSTVASDKAVVTLAAGSTASRSFSFVVKNQTPKGVYTVVVAARDATGTVTQAGSFTAI